jgi:putative endonuclease
MHYVYLLEDTENRTYIGSTNDLRRRFSEHQKGKSSSTRGRSWTLIYYEAYRAESDARRREQQLKSRGQAVRQLRERVRESRRKQS